MWFILVFINGNREVRMLQGSLFQSFLEGETIPLIKIYLKSQFINLIRFFFPPEISRSCATATTSFLHHSLSHDVYGINFLYKLIVSMELGIKQLKLSSRLLKMKAFLTFHTSLSWNCLFKIYLFEFKCMPIIHLVNIS